MQVILRENIDKLGRVGDIVNVSDGYARNFLLPRNLVVAANLKNKAELEHQKKIYEKKRQAQKLEAEELAKKVGGYSCTIRRKVGEKDKLFGSVTAHDISVALKESGFDVDKRFIHLETPIKSLGAHSVIVKLESDVSAAVSVQVVPEK